MGAQRRARGGEVAPSARAFAKDARGGAAGQTQQSSGPRRATHEPQRVWICGDASRSAARTLQTHFGMKARNSDDHWRGSERLGAGSVGMRKMAAGGGRERVREG